MAEGLILEQHSEEICYFRQWREQLDRWRVVTGCALCLFVRMSVYKRYFVEQIELGLYSYGSLSPLCLYKL